MRPSWEEDLRSALILVECAWDSVPHWTPPHLQLVRLTLLCVRAGVCAYPDLVESLDELEAGLDAGLTEEVRPRLANLSLTADILCETACKEEEDLRTEHHFSEEATANFYLAIGRTYATTALKSAWECALDNGHYAAGRTLVALETADLALIYGPGDNPYTPEGTMRVIDSGMADLLRAAMPLDVMLRS